MRASWKLLIQRKSISWQLIAVLLFVTLLPAHYHLHHHDSAETAAHAHSIDLHLISDDAGQSHHDEDTSIFAATPDVIAKKDKPGFSVYIPLAILLVLILVHNHQSRIRHDQSDQCLEPHYSYFSPPLRAPPPA
jgi:hypothetical protein